MEHRDHGQVAGNQQEQQEEQLPTHLEQGEAPDTDARLHGEDAEQPLGRTVDGTEPAEAQLPGIGEPGAVITYAPTPVDGHAQAVSQTKAYHAGFEAALWKYRHNVDGTDYIGMGGDTLAKALDHNDGVLKSKLDALTREANAELEPA